MNAQVLTDGLAGLAHFDLPALNGEHAPAFLTPSECKKWLGSIAITNATQSQGQLEHQLDLLNRYEVSLSDRLKIVDLLRSPCYFVHGECLKRFALRRPSFPLGSMEQMTFDASQSLWEGLMTSYLHCLQALLEKSTQVKRLGNGDREAAALVASRALSIAQSVFLDHCSVGLKPGTTFWRRLHRIYLAAETLGVAELGVTDKLARGSEVTSSLLYVETLLLATALPHTLRPKQLANIVYWAHRWAGKVTLLQAPPADLRTPPLCVNLADALPPGFHMPISQMSGDTALRWLDMAALRKTIKQRLVKLAEGLSPQELKLGKNCTQPGCERLLRQVYGVWCKGGRLTIGDVGEPAENIYEIAMGHEAIHYHLSGRVLRNPTQSLYLNKKAADEIATFGHVATHHDTGAKAGQTVDARFPLERWQSCRESLHNIELWRPMEPAGAALHSDALVAVHRQGDSGFQLARLAWLSVEPDAAKIHMALHLMPGVARAVTVSIPGSGVAKARHERAYCLPAIGSLQQLATVLIPAGCFRLGLVIEICDEGTRRVRLGQLLDRGIDFDRCTYEAA